VGLKGCKPEAWNASKGHTIEGSPHPSVLQTASFDYSYNTLSFCATKYYRRASNLICRKPLENGNFFVSSYTGTIRMPAASPIHRRFLRSWVYYHSFVTVQSALRTLCRACAYREGERGTHFMREMETGVCASPCSLQVPDLDRQEFSIHLPWAKDLFHEDRVF
jgi:hypothetical protein